MKCHYTFFPNGTDDQICNTFTKCGKQYDIYEDTVRIYIADNLEYVDDCLAGCFDKCSVKFEEEW